MDTRDGSDEARDDSDDVKIFQKLDRTKKLESKDGDVDLYDEDEKLRQMALAVFGVLLGILIYAFYIKK